MGNGNGNIVLPSVLDSIDVNQYKTEAEYLEAAADLTVKRGTPEFQDAFRRVQMEYQERKSEENKAKIKAEIKRLTDKMELTPKELEECKKQAYEKADTDYKAGKISAASVSEKAYVYEGELVRCAKEKKATNKYMNDALRGASGAR